MLNILALDTSTPRAAVAVETSDGVIRVARPDPGRAARPRPGPHRSATCSGRRAWRRGRLDVFAVGLGPGSYTGLRIGLTAAKMLAYATGRPLVGFDSLEAIARNAPADALRVAVVADAQRGDLYAADFARERPAARSSGSRRRGSSPSTAGSPRSTPTRWCSAPAWTACAHDWPRAVSRPPTTPIGPTARRLPALAREPLATGRRDDPWFLEPLYLRRSAAEDQWERKAPPGDRRHDHPRPDQRRRRPVADQVGLRAPVEPLPDPPARGGSGDVPEPDRADDRPTWPGRSCSTPAAAWAATSGSPPRPGAAWSSAST